MTYFFETYGCQMNHAESASVEQTLISRGWTRAGAAEDADLVIINTCSVRITAETRVFGRLAHFTALKKKRAFTLLVMGCMAERLHEELQQRFPKVDFVVGMFERQIFIDIFQALEEKRPYISIDEKPVNEYFFAPSSYESGAFQTFVPIMNGCNNFCSYCIVPYVRGREVSRAVDEILAELDVLADKGVREITLLGQNVNSYRFYDPETEKTVNFPALLTAIVRHIEKKGSIRWVRFMSSHPKDLSDELIEVIAREELVCSFIHLPVQHGSNRILQAMNRRYTRESYLSLIGRIREKIPGVTFSTDILVGFPGETEEDVEQTIDLIKTIRFDAAYMYYYNPREGTKACSFPDQVPESVRKERLARIIKLQNSLSADLMRKRVGKTVPVLVESTSRNNPEELFGHTELGEMVVFEGKNNTGLIGNFVEAELICLRGRTFRARIKEAGTDILSR
ncbi:tRNA (N6-isopentenyl adenosine(37)-C2)-methylthiotransferase MiaB [Brucepastera parasyntrophica]|uniref:tRNA (N6-isopentenyl adenosine(37)-C2)-methylthiotransferase MiaB n=1 Tax=Brucepastera parasyntrophica TaxID=2880008 RepID=UPI00210C14CC|nr:tRNA (N6-isopentenyl adenosine(37)-C2)-methylthiotransferase MiaB [Brucepastera parasyntrophica]ULQ60601.1 tRNA (N6-isopentenyl adenosine(37)-C2)-methylthiotransferase MiaB [Brucepastera parasyntrophica]